MKPGPEGLSIIIPVHNEYENTVKCVESIRMLADVEPLDVIVVDNASTDGLREWAQTQTDFTYVFFEDVFLPYGDVLNQVFTGMPLREYVLVLSCRFMITEGYLSSMLKTLRSHPEAGLCSGLSNGAYSLQQTLSFQRFKQEGGMPDFFAYGFSEDALLFRSNLLDKTGPFDEKLAHLTSVAKDLSLRLLRAHIPCVVCGSAFLFAWRSEHEEPSDIRALIGNDNAALAQTWGTQYLQLLGNRHIVDILEEPDDKPLQVLEVGCDIGGTLFLIKQKYPHAEIRGCDISEASVNIASFSMDAFLNNIEDENLPFEKESLDVVVFGDVLEHLHNPSRTVSYVRGLLKEDGCILTSIPNVMNIEVMKGLLHGDFTYTEIGLLDRTHIHLFTYNEIIRMFDETGFTIERVEHVNSDLSQDDRMLIEKLCALDPAAEPFMYQTFQYVVRARKKGRM